MWQYSLTKHITVKAVYVAIFINQTLQSRLYMWLYSLTKHLHSMLYMCL